MNGLRLFFPSHHYLDIWLLAKITHFFYEVWTNSMYLNFLFIFCQQREPYWHFLKHVISALLHLGIWSGLMNVMFCWVICCNISSVFKEKIVLSLSSNLLTALHIASCFSCPGKNWLLNTCVWLFWAIVIGVYFLWIYDKIISWTAIIK